jgi:protein-L-isoaspartate O-methyltransferase
MLHSLTLDEYRRFYAGRIRFAANVISPALVAAFGQVPRETFLGPGYSMADRLG